MAISASANITHHVSPHMPSCHTRGAPMVMRYLFRMSGRTGQGASLWATPKYASAVIKLSETVFSSSGLIRAALTKEVVRKSARLSIQCIDGTTTRSLVMCILPMLRPETPLPRPETQSQHGFRPFEIVDGSLGAGHSRNSLPLLTSNSSP